LPEYTQAITGCMGGRTAFLANAKLKLKCATSYYGGRIAPDLLKHTESLSGSMIFFWGGKDAHIGQEQQHRLVESLKIHQKSFINVEFGDADHGFFCDQRPSFNKDAANQSWSLVQQHF
jgi:carboxymethylenebutenolidase